jgi:hypothetical protein
VDVGAQDQAVVVEPVDGCLGLVVQYANGNLIPCWPGLTAMRPQVAPLLSCLVTFVDSTEVILFLRKARFSISCLVYAAIKLCFSTCE